MLDQVEALTIPEDLEGAFAHHAGSKYYFLNQSKTVKKMLLQWITLAKRTDTRKKRIEEIAELAAQGRKLQYFSL